MTGEQMPLARALYDRIAPAEQESPLLAAIRAGAAGVRARPRLSPWYLALPAWLPFHGGRTWEQFCAQFDESARRTNITANGVVGFEVEPQAGQLRRHRIGWLDTPGEEPRA